MTSKPSLSPHGGEDSSRDHAQGEQRQAETEGWRLIETAPRDGSEVLAASKSRSSIFRFPFPVRSRYVDGRWCFQTEAGWRSYAPQPTHWKPAPTDGAK